MLVHPLVQGRGLIALQWEAGPVYPEPQRQRWHNSDSRAAARGALLR